MTIDEYMQKSYNALVKLGVLEKVLINTGTCPLYPENTVNNDLVDCLFYWADTPEGRDYWQGICNTLPRHLKNGCYTTRRDAYHRLLALHESQQPQPYEFW